jgi:hypothetical protein
MSEIKKASTEIEKFADMLKRREHFAFQRFADGELWILQGKKFQLSPKSKHHAYKNPEDWKTFNPKKHKIQMNHLFDALRYKAPNYFLGLLVGNSENNHTWTDWILKESGQEIRQVTFANLFVNSNYTYFTEYFLTEFKNWKIVIVCNERAVIDSDVLPNIVQRFNVGSNCIVNDYQLVETLKEFVKHNKVQDHLFLFACSSLGNFCIRELAQIEPNNTYIDCGSTLNPYIGLSSDRAYLAAFGSIPYRGGPAPADALYEEESWPWSKQV